MNSRDFVREALSLSGTTLLGYCRRATKWHAPPTSEPRARRARHTQKAVLILISICVLALEARANVYNVTSANDSGAGSLRQAILDANSHAGADTIFFSIGSGGAKTITLTSDLPLITSPVTIDATSQPAYPGRPIIELNGNNVVATGLNIMAGNCTIEGLVIDRFTGSGIVLFMNGNNTIINNYIGISSNGLIDRGNGNSGISIEQGSSNNVIGGTIAGTRNVISGNEINGIQILSGNSNQVVGNYIGTNAAGTAALGNSSSGIRVFTAGNLIGSPTGTGRNLVSGNGGVGISVEGTAATGNAIQSNYVGVDVTGTVKLGNETGILVSGSNNIVGGTTAGTLNLVGGNSGYGVSIGGAANKLIGNYIGIALNGSTKLGNGSGLSLIGSDHVIGGAGAGNLISGNDNDGIYGQDLNAISIKGNLIGTDASGTAAVGNGGVGMRLVNISGSTVGGLMIAERNLVSANTIGGMTFEGATSTGNTMIGNFVGTDQTGTLKLGNGFGIGLGGYHNTIGGTASGAGNLISGNTDNGIGVYDASNCVIQGNLIGTNLAGTGALGNDGFGIYMINVTGLTVGGTTAAARNVISGNGRAVGLHDASSGNLVQGNFIGVDVTGAKKMANHGSGVELGGVNNIIGGTVPGAGNVISGNDYDGVGLFGTAINNNKIQGNLIGLNATGTAAIGNGTGVRIIDASNTLVGGTVPEARNIISGNFRGVTVDGLGSGTVIQGNYIGTDITGNNAVPNDEEGVVLGNSNNLVGGTVAGARNIISGNGDGVRINGAVATGNLVQGNYVGTKLNGTDPLPNVYVGIQISAGFNNMIGGTTPGAANIVANNNYAGVVLDSGTGNAILGNSIFNNARLGIELSGQDAVGLNENDPGDPDSGANWKQNYPMLTSVIAAGGNTSIQGKLNSNPNKQFRLEFFSNTSCDGTGFGEGQKFIGSASVTTDGNGDAIINTSLPLTPTGQFITATATSPTNDTSEFSPCALVGGANPGALQFESSFFLAEEFVGTGIVTVTRTNGMTGAVSVDYATSNGLATSPDDYTATSGTLHFADGEVIKTFTVPVVYDSLFNEPQEGLNLTLSNPTGGAMLGSQSTSTLLINNDNPTYPGSIFSDATVVEGNSGTAEMVFTITLSPHTIPMTIGYATADGLATAPADYQSTSGQLVFDPGENSKTVSVLVNGDTLKEGNEMFFLNLQLQSAGYTMKSVGEGLIIDDDDASSFQFSQSSFTANESAGAATITVTRTGDTTSAAAVNYATLDDTAAAPGDYTATSGTLTFAAGETSKTFNVSIADDAKFEGDEKVTLKLSSPTGGASLGAPSTAELKIVDNDTPPNVSVSDISLAEGNNGTTQFTFAVGLSAPSGLPVTVDYATADNTAMAGSDYQSLMGQLTFAPNEVSKSVVVAVVGDTQLEPDETFFVNLSTATNATIAKAQGTGTIQNDDAGLAGSVEFSSAAFNVGEGKGQATITVKRQGGSNGAISVQYATVAGGSATPGSDYTLASGLLNWADGDTTDKTFIVSIADDSTDEADETINLSLSNPGGGAALGAANAVINLTDNDPSPAISISDISQAEGNNGMTQFNFQVSLSAASGQAVSVNYATADNTAQAGSDYQASSALISFAPGETSKTVSINVIGDAQAEPSETFAVNLSSSSNATITKAQGIGTIIDDDASAPTTTIEFAQAAYAVQEDLGAINLTVTRTGDTSAAASVDYVTVDGSAVQKTDFEYAAGTLKFGPGETSKTLLILINEDMFLEGGENFTLALSNAAGATLGAQASTTVNISDDSPESVANPIDDAQAFVYTHYHDFLNREPDAAGLAFWTSQITACGSDQQCINAKRVDVSASFFLSIEFQETAYLLYLMQKESYATTPKYASFMRDLQEVSRGVIVNAPGWQQKLSDNQQQFADQWTSRSEFKAAYDAMSNDAYVNALYQHAGIVPPQADKDKLVAALNTSGMNRSAVLLQVAADTNFRQQEQNAAFVLMEYFGYLRRDPNALPDTDLSGYNFWLTKLNQFGGNYLDAEMVRAFITSIEYRQRFGP